MLLQYRVKRALLQVWPIQALMPLKSKRMLNTLNNTSSEPQLDEKQKKAEYDKQYRKTYT
jgi:hypothetical protein